MLDIQNQEKMYTLTISPVEKNNKNKKMNKRKFYISKYVLLVFIISLIVFVGTFIGYKIVQDFNLKNVEKTLIVNFIGFFNIFIFICIIFWILIASIYNVFDFSSIEKKISWKIFTITLFLLMFTLLVIAITFFILLLIEVVKNGKNYKFDNKWFDNMANFFIENIEGSKNLNYIMLFTSSISWSVLSTVYFAANKVFTRKNEEKFKLIKVNTNENEKVNNLMEQKNNISDKSYVQSEENIKKEENKKEDTSTVKEIKKEDNWLLEMEENKNNSKDEKTKENEIKKEDKKMDENDPYSLFQ